MVQLNSWHNLVKNKNSRDGRENPCQRVCLLANYDAPGNLHNPRQLRTEVEESYLNSTSSFSIQVILPQ
jgi:hypothetical protein